MPSFAAITLGCKVNQYETQALSALVTALGLSRHDPSGPSAPPDLVVINTCAVTSAAVAKCRRLLRQAVRQNSSADLLIVGCAASAHAGALERSARQAGATGRLAVIGHGEDLSAQVRQWLARIEEPPPERQVHESENQNTEQGGWYNTSTPQFTLAGQRKQRRAGFQERTRRNPIYGNVFNTIRPSLADNVNSPFQPSPLPAIADFTDHQRAFVKVQDGCDAFCTYCIVPHLRRALWSRPAHEILAECRGLVKAGYHEVVLCGIFLGAYGQHTALRRNWTAPPALGALLEQLLWIDGLRPIRLSSLDPLDVTPAMLDLYAGNRALAAHFHLSIQSGSDRILKRMNRQYRRGDVLAEIARIRGRLDRPAFSTDIIVGFPGETEEDFEQTLDLVGRVGLSRVHIFPFSPRRLTAAWAWRKEMPPTEQVRQRCRRLAELAADLGAKYRQQFVGQCVEVIVEHPDSHTPAGHARGLTDRYIEVLFPLPTRLAGRVDVLLRQVVTVKAETLTRHGLAGTMIE